MVRVIGLCEVILEMVLAMTQMKLYVKNTIIMWINLLD